jgi:rhodanese-related sulfurtransferase
MERLIEFAGNHPFLVIAVLLMIAVVIVSEIRLRIQAFAAVDPNQAVRLMNQGALVLDVREPASYQAGHIADARNVSVKNLAEQAESLKKYREKPVIAYCDTGMSGATAARELAKLGFAKVVNLHGGLEAWRKENLPVTSGKDKPAGNKAA